MKETIKKNKRITLFTEVCQKALKANGFSCSEYLDSIVKAGFREFYMLDIYNQEGKQINKDEKPKKRSMNEIKAKCKEYRYINLMCSKK